MCRVPHAAYAIVATVTTVTLTGAHAAPQASPGRTQVVLLGTGNPAPTPDRSGPSTAIIVNGEAYLVDFGPGVVRRAAAAQQKGIAALNPTNILHAFVTHLHSDHTLGYPDLIFTPWVVGRKRPLEIYGPRGIKVMTDHLLAAWAEDIKIRNSPIEQSINGGPEGYRVNVHEVSPGIVYRDSNVTVTAFNVKHGEWGPRAFGYRFTTRDRSIVISGDTGPSESIVEQCKGCDILIHEVYTEAGYTKAPPDWQRMRREYHTSTRQLADLATRAHPVLLVLNHQSYYRESTEEDLMREMGAAYGGRFVSGHDLDIF